MVTANNKNKYITTLRQVLLPCILLLTSGCFSAQQVRSGKALVISPVKARPRPFLEEERIRLATTAHSFIGRSKLSVGKTSFRSDCSGAIRAIFAAAKLRLGGIIKQHGDNDVKTIYRYVQRYGQIIKSDPKPGDLVFFHNTYDRSRNGRFNDALTHVGLVEKVEGNTILFVHHLGRSVIRSRMNLSLAESSFDPKTNERINHVLRRAQGQYRAYTAAELFAAFGRL